MPQGARIGRVPIPPGHRLCSRSDKDCINGFVPLDETYKQCASCRAKRRGGGRSRSQHAHSTSLDGSTSSLGGGGAGGPSVGGSEYEDVTTTTPPSELDFTNGHGGDIALHGYVDPDIAPELQGYILGEPQVVVPRRRKPKRKADEAISVETAPLENPPEDFDHRDVCLAALQERYQALGMRSEDEFIFFGVFEDPDAAFDDTGLSNEARKVVDAYLHSIKALICKRIELTFPMRDSKARRNPRLPFTIRYACGQNLETAKRPKGEKRQRQQIERWQCNGRLAVSYAPMTGQTSVRFSHHYRHPRHPSYTSTTADDLAEANSSIEPSYVNVAAQQQHLGGEVDVDVHYEEKEAGGSDGEQQQHGPARVDDLLDYHDLMGDGMGIPVSLGMAH